MIQRTSEDNIYLIESLYAQGFTPVEIERETGISYNVVYYSTRVIDRGFVSRYEYESYLASRRQRRKANRTLGGIIKNRLKRLKRDRYWLAKNSGVSVTTISNYSTGRYLPRKDIQKRIFRALGLNHRTLDDLI